MALLEGLDATHLATFETQDLSIAGVSALQHDVVQGKSAGSTWLQLSGRSNGPLAVLNVSDELVWVSELVARVVTGASWASDDAPASEFLRGASLTLRAVLRNWMAAEGDSGQLFTRVVWSDGHEEDVGYGSPKEVWR